MAEHFQPKTVENRLIQCIYQKTCSVLDSLDVYNNISGIQRDFFTPLV